MNESQAQIINYVPAAPALPSVRQVRMLDVFLVGPFMIWFGFSSKGSSDWARFAMVGLGVATILYNWMNWRAEG